MGHPDNWKSKYSDSQIILFDKKVNSLLKYFYECEGYKQNFATIHRDACIHRYFHHYHNFSTEYSYILSSMVEKGYLETWHDDNEHHTYYGFTKKYRRLANLKKLNEYGY